MRESVSTITSKGQVTIPAPVRRLLGLKQGDKIVFVTNDKGEVALRAAQFPNLESIYRSVPKLNRSMSWAEIEQAAKDERAEDYLRELGGSVR